MRALAIFLATLLLAATQAGAQVPGVGMMVQGPSGTAAYVGPGDIVASASVWYGLRAYSSADRGNKLINLCTPADAHCEDETSDATTGALTLGTFGSTCNNSTVICTIKIWYDRSGHALDATQATSNKRATFVTSCLGSLACAAFLGSTPQIYPIGNSTIAQPLSAAVVADRTGNFTTLASIIGSSGTARLGWNGTTNTLMLNFGSATTKTSVSDSAFHAMQYVASGASSSISSDGSSSNVSAGTNSLASASFGAATGAGAGITADLVEAGIWPVAFNGTEISSINSNAHAFWGF